MNEKVFAVRFKKHLLRKKKVIEENLKRNNLKEGTAERLKKEVEKIDKLLEELK